MKVSRVKSTFSWRARLAVVVPHSMSTAPDATASIRLSGVTGTYCTFSEDSPSSCPTA